MNYHFKHLITHKDKTVSDKVNYFADYFYFTLSAMGRPGFPVLENHRAILEKINFQLENYSKYAPAYINKHFKSEYLNSKDPLIEEFYPKEWQLINQLKIEFNQNNKDRSRRESLITAITDLLEKFENSIFENSLKIIIRTIECKEDLSKHNHIETFEYCTNIILCEFVFAGLGVNDLRDLFDKVLAREIKQIDGKVHTDAPLPQELLAIRDDDTKTADDFYNAAFTYLENRDLKQQFEGIFHLFKAAIRDKTYLFRLTNIKAHNPMSFNYNNVCISNELKGKYVTNQTRETYAEFFAEEKALFAEITIKEGNDDAGKINAVTQVQFALDYFNFVLEKNAAILPNDYIVKDKGHNRRHTSFVDYPVEGSDVKFKRHNPYEIFKGKSSPIIKKCLQLDTLYLIAVTQEREELKVAEYWRFLESFFSSQNFDAEKIKNTVSKILSEKNIGLLAGSYFNPAYHIIHMAWYTFPNPINDNNDVNSYLNISNKELRNLCTPRITDKIEFKRLSEIINQPYINRKYKWFLESTKMEKSQVLFDSYINCLSETYEQRNFVQHSGIYHGKSLQKILQTLPEIASRFREIIISELKKEGYDSIDDLITALAISAGITLDD